MQEAVAMNMMSTNLERMILTKNLSTDELDGGNCGRLKSGRDSASQVFIYNSSRSLTQAHADVPKPPSSSLLDRLGPPSLTSSDSNRADRRTQKQDDIPIPHSPKRTRRSSRSRSPPPAYEHLISPNLRSEASLPYVLKLYRYPRSDSLCAELKFEALGHAKNFVSKTNRLWPSVWYHSSKLPTESCRKKYVEFTLLDDEKPASWPSDFKSLKPPQEVV
ncbi:hypothetical protein PSTG_07698 [Puccinia striiformis f. sp. tritici PST-78]|uniref:Uncharacterized protein n=1 Tax=Puccinia striiformis f. sp. tritici PST-78 TaxID=1165861 RepID=A0A0L0VIL6_9BASI|nr:hypothetical protein PSTG_07698 [Puccinia striiformis f. sp. tritici PST-78]